MQTEELTHEQLKNKLAFLEARVLASLRQTNTAIHMLQTSHNLGLTHAQRNGVEKVVEQLLINTQSELHSTVYIAGDGKPVDVDGIPF